MIKMISYPEDSKPHIDWNRLDGPLLICKDGTLHWLTQKERLWMKLGFTNIDRLNNKHSREDCKG
jgi:hypothetical protein